MEGNPEDIGVAMDNQKTIKRCKLESVQVPDPVTIEPVEDFQKQSTTHGQTKTSNSGIDCRTQSSDGGEVSSKEFAFSIDHVLEQIMSSLDHSSVLTCRLVSRKWRLASTAMILKRVETPIAFEYNPTDQVYYLKERYKAHGDAVKSTLEDLTRFLTKSYSPSGPSKMSEFPCNNFEFLGNSLSDPQLRKFLTLFGEYIRVLSLNFWHALQSECEATLIKHIGHLLNTQAPRLRCLHFTPSSELESTETDDSDRDDATPRSNPSILSPPFQSEQESMKAQRKGKNGLRELHCDMYGIPRKILDFIISISPDLQEISLDWEHYHLLCSPLNRLHFLKEFNFSCCDDNFDFLNHFKLLEAALCISQEERDSLTLPPIKFRGLAMSFDDVLDFEFQNRFEIGTSVLNVINKILELSWDTLEYIKLNNLDGTNARNDEITFPPVLPKVRHLDLCSKMAWNFGLEMFSSHENFKFKETFPKLKTLHFDKVISYYNEISSAGWFLQDCNFGPAPSVKSVVVTLQLDDIPPGEDVVEDVELLRLDITNSLVRLFPSAELIIEDELY